MLTRHTKVIVQGITGRHGAFHTQQMLHYGTRIVAGVTPGKAGESVAGVPVFNSVRDALRTHKATWSVIFVPAAFAKNAALEALRCNLHLVIITEGIPVHDTLAILEEARMRKCHVIGPNGPGITRIGVSKLGIMPNNIFLRGDVGIVSRSGTLTYEVVDQLTQKGTGQSTVIGIGGDKVRDVDFVQTLQWFERDKHTKKIVMIGEIGGTSEQHAIPVIKRMKKPVIAFIAGRSAPKGKSMGHAGAIIHGDGETAEAKIKALREAGVTVVDKPSQIALKLRKV